MAEWTKHEKTRTRRDLMRVKVTPTGLQQAPNSPANTAKTDLVVPPVVPLAAKMDCNADLNALIESWPTLPASTKATIAELIEDPKR